MPMLKPLVVALTKAEAEALRAVASECAAGDPQEFFRDACGMSNGQAANYARALRRAMDALSLAGAPK